MSVRRLDKLLARVRAFGPYVAVEILLPGGTLVAFLLWLLERFAAVGLGGMHPRLAGQIRDKAAIAAKPHAPTPSSETRQPCSASTRVLEPEPTRRAGRARCDSPTPGTNSPVNCLCLASS